METLLNRPARSLQYFVIGKQWSADLDFHRAELIFLNRLLNDYSMKLSAPHYIGMLKDIKKDLSIVEEQSQKTAELLNLQMVLLELMYDDVIPENVQSLEAKQIELEYLMNDLNKAFRKTKKVLFRIIEELVQNDELYD